MIFVDTFEYETKDGIVYDVEVTVDQYFDVDFGHTNKSGVPFTDILKISVFDHLGEDISEDIDISEIEDYCLTRDYSDLEE